MHLNDAFGREKELKKIYCHNEQACSMAADAYARVSGDCAAVVVTTGPGGINALNGVFGAYVDSLPMIVISGQIKNETLKTNFGIPLRQLGDQEVDILEMVVGITKARIQCKRGVNPLDLIETAVDIANEGRPGPVWIDVPIDIQSSNFDSGQKSEEFEFTVSPNTYFENEDKNIIRCEVKAAELVYEKLTTSKRPAILVGTGVRISRQIDDLLSFIKSTNIPVLTGWNAHDAVPDYLKNYIGRPGSIGNRMGNICLQECDFLLVLGCRLNIRQITYNYLDFARNAEIAMVDIDEAELLKPTLNIQYPIKVNLKQFIPELAKRAAAGNPGFFELHEEYLASLHKTKAELNEKAKYKNDPNGNINPYIFVMELSELLEEDSIIVCADGTACVATFQVAEIKKGTRLFTNSGCASMGYDLPAAIGAAAASPGKRLVCIAGDGSIMMNLQELQTIKTLGIKLQIFILNNQGYHSIRQTQQNFFSDNITGCGPDSGLEFPDFHRLAEAFGYSYSSVEKNKDLRSAIAFALGQDLHICNVDLDLEQQFEPKVMSKRLPDGSMVTGTLDDMWPYLDK